MYSSARAVPLFGTAGRGFGYDPAVAAARKALAASLQRQAAAAVRPIFRDNARVLRGYKLDSTFGAQLCTYLEQRDATGQLIWLCADTRPPRLADANPWFWADWLLSPGGHAMLVLLQTLMGDEHGKSFMYDQDSRKDKQFMLFSLVMPPPNPQDITPFRGTAPVPD
jgi:hypothetical protein